MIISFPWFTHNNSPNRFYFKSESLNKNLFFPLFLYFLKIIRVQDVQFRQILAVKTFQKHWISSQRKFLGVLLAPWRHLSARSVVSHRKSPLFIETTPVIRLIYFMRMICGKGGVQKNSVNWKLFRCNLSEVFIQGENTLRKWERNFLEILLVNVPKK